MTTPQIGTTLAEWCINRIIMFALITSSVSYGLVAPPTTAIKAATIGATLSAAGFYLDHLTDHKQDQASGKMNKPIARGAITPKTAQLIILLNLTATTILTLTTNPWILLPTAAVILTVHSLNDGTLDTPILRAIGLGALQAYYVIIGAQTANRLEPATIPIALYLFFAMTGARAIGDVRDLPHDQQTNTNTIPKKYGLRFTGNFLLINEIAAYTVGLLAYTTGILGPAYVYSMIGTIIVGLPLSLIFARRPDPKTANTINMLSFGILGTTFGRRWQPQTPANDTDRPFCARPATSPTQEHPH